MLKASLRVNTQHKKLIKISFKVLNHIRINFLVKPQNLQEITLNKLFEFTHSFLPESFVCKILKMAGLLTYPPSRLPSHSTWTVVKELPSGCLHEARIHSSGYCSGFSPDSLLWLVNESWQEHHYQLQRYKYF